MITLLQVIYCFWVVRRDVLQVLRIYSGYIPLAGEEMIARAMVREGVKRKSKLLIEAGLDGIDHIARCKDL